MGMLTIRLMGGLGNQMFQYAFGRRLVAAGHTVMFDTENGFRYDPYGRRYALDAFSVQVGRAEPQDIPLGMNWRTPWHRMAKAGWLAVPRRWQRVVYERMPFQFDESAVSGENDSAYYVGHWQNEGYFLKIRDMLKREFSVRPMPNARTLSLLKDMSECRAVSVHVRRYQDVGADGRVIREAQKYHEACAVDYYRRAVERIGCRPGTVCFVFSDNPQWAKANLNLPVPCRYVADLCQCSDAEEVLLMASCQHHVISNSSFSWWGAWLGRDGQKVIVAPRMWMRGIPENAVDICPPEWVRI